MRAPIRTFVCLLVLGAAAAGSWAQGLRLEGLSGQSLHEDELRNGNVIAVVWASWSPRCRDIVERVNALDRDWKGRARVLTVVFQEDAAKVEGFLAGRRLNAPIFLDPSGSFSKKYGVATLPTLLVFRQGEVVYRDRLADDADRVLERVLR